MRNSGHVTVAKSYKNLISNFLVLSLLLCFTGLTVACGGLSQGASGSPNTSSGQTAAGRQLIVSIPSQPATVGVPYNAVSAVSGGSAPYFFSISDGTLAPGLALNRTTGSITGIPLVAGTYNSVLWVSDSRESDSRQKEYGSDSVRHGSSSMRIVVSDGNSGIKISISPNSTTIPSNGQQHFTANISGTPDTSVTWSASGGTISSSGAFTAPKVTRNTSVIITATSAAKASLHAAATVTVTSLAPLAVTTSALAKADAGMPYTASLSAAGGVAPYHWSLATGAMPSGIQLQPASGVITGMTALTGSYPFTAKVTDSSGQTAKLAFTLAVSSAIPSSSNSGFDAPAELPRTYIQTAMSNTPAPGSTSTVNSGGDLQSALNNASCGDTIQLQAGATFAGTFTFPAKSCDDSHWIIIRTSASDSSLPPEGTRLTPCYAGVSSLPGRPGFGCSVTHNVLARLLMNSSAMGPIVFASGANHYRLIGLEITRAAGIGVVYNLASVSGDKIVFDRVWMHGTAQDETTRGVGFLGGTNISIVDSFFTDFHCISGTGVCTDAQAIAGGGGNVPMGPYKIVDNFVEAAGEGIMFGGAAATATPTDIEIRHNHIFKPLTWLKGQPGYVGGSNGNPFIVKNLLELKNAQRVLVEGNIMDYSWGGFSQSGFGILLTPKNQNRGGTGVCPLCQVTDVTIRYNTIRHVGGGMQIANALDGPAGPPLDGQRYSIHDIVIDDIDRVKYHGSGMFAQISVQAGAPVLQNLTINHVTAFPSSALFVMGAPPTKLMNNFVFTNNIVFAGIYPIWSPGGPAPNCASADVPITTLNACFTHYTFAANAIIATPSAFPSSKWPSRNFFPAAAAAVQFANYNAGNSGYYYLQPSSPYKGLGTDGKDLGADMDAVESATAGAE